MRVGALDANRAVHVGAVDVGRVRRHASGVVRIAAFAIVEAVLAESRGLSLLDIRNQDSAGADGFDEGRDIWVELKTHGRDAPDSVRLEPSEAELAELKRGRYWLVIIWDLEKPRTPKFVVIPDPLRRLDTYLGRGLRLSGVQELARSSS